MKVCLIGGLPGTGKSHLVRQILAGWGRPSGYGCGLVQGQYYLRPNVLVLGHYQGQTFDGTDRLSMALAPQLAGQLPTLGYHLLGEGDRVWARVVFDAALAADPGALLLILEASPLIRTRRLASRPATQDPTWVRGRATKLENLARAYPVIRRRHESPADTDELAGLVLAHLAA